MPTLLTMSLGDETIELLPLRNWGQLDVHKWGPRGKLPGTPAGLEVTPDHVKIAGETVAIADPEATRKLEKLFNEWLELENTGLELARQKAQRHAEPARGPVARGPRQQALRFRVEVDKRGQVHILCVRGAELVASAGLSIPGLTGLANQGLMRKPRGLDVGALHDWIELDGELFSFEHGNNDAARLEELLNKQYLPLGGGSSARDILLFANAASPTGFDIQFPVTLGGVQESRRRTFNDAALELLQEPVRCGLLQPGIILKISPPTLIIKRKTPEGGEDYLQKDETNVVTLADDSEQRRLIDLSRPVNYTHLNVVELTAVFNHPAINRHSSAPVGATTAVEVAAEPVVSQPPPFALPYSCRPPSAAALPRLKPEPAQPVDPPSSNRVLKAALAAGIENPGASVGTAPRKPVAPAPVLPNTWLKDILAREPIRHDWLTCLLYRRIAEHFGNSAEGDLGFGGCWRVLLSEINDPDDSRFRALFLTQKGGLGFIGGARFARFHRGVVFMGTRDSVLEAIDVQLRAVSLVEHNKLAFILSDDFHSKFGVPMPTVTKELQCLRELGAELLSLQDVLQSAQALQLVWTVPAEQADPAEPRVREHRPGDSKTDSQADPMV